MKKTSQLCLKTPPAAERGFTLVEVLVALAILGAVAAGVLSLISQNTRFVAAAEDQMIAGIVADNAVVDALARRADLDRGESEEVVTVTGRNWLVRRTVTELGVDNMVRIDIEVRDSEGRQKFAGASTIKAERP